MEIALGEGLERLEKTTLITKTNSVMKRIHDSILALVKPARVNSAAEELGETPHKVEAGVDAILPHLLDRLMAKGGSKEVEQVLAEAKKLKIYENYDRIWKGSGIDTHVNIGERLENRLLGVDSTKYRDSVATKTGLKKEHVDRLTNWIAGTIAAWFAGEMAHGKTFTALIAELKGEHVVHHRKPAAAAHAPAPRKEVVRKKKCRWCWLWWLIAIILLALLLWWLLRSCECRRPEPVVEQVVTEVRTVHQAPKYTEEKMILPDGTHITMYKGDIESAIDAFLASDKFKNATDKELRSVWFEFSDIDFEHNSATELMAGAERQLGIVTAALKKHPEVKIRIGAFADKTGTRAVNFAISEARARNIEKALEAGGIAADRVTYEGFGEQYATVPEAESNERRAPDRDVAMRFTK